MNLSENIVFTFEAFLGIQTDVVLRPRRYVLIVENKENLLM